MAWIFLEGLDRTGKTTIGKMMEKNGFEYVHMKSPDKKYSQPGYVGPSYMDELTELYIHKSNKDVVFDRSAYGEFVWPHVFGRAPLLTEEDIEILNEFEVNNQTQYILMHDANIEAHWARCVANKEPVNRAQFAQAGKLYERLCLKYKFVKKQLSDFGVAVNYLTTEEHLKKAVNTDIQTTQTIAGNSTAVTNVQGLGDNVKLVPPNSQKTNVKTTEQRKLERANAINGLLSNRLIKRNGAIYDSIEQEIRLFLQRELSITLGGATSTPETNNLSKDEVEFIKLLVKNSKLKMENKK